MTYISSFDSRDAGIRMLQVSHHHVQLCKFCNHFLVCVCQAVSPGVTNLFGDIYLVVGYDLAALLGWIRLTHEVP